MAQKQRAEGEPIVIKKYANRRLYNTAKSSYVTLDDLSRMVRAGDDFKVFDAKTGEEITRSVLTQIIFEEEAKGQNMLPTNFLRQLIRLYGDALQGVVPSYLDASMEAFARNQERMREAFGTAQPMQTFQAMARSNMEWFEQAMRMFGPFRPPSGQAAPTAEQPATAPQSEAVSPQDLDALQRQLAEMQAQLARLSTEATANLAAAAASGTAEPPAADDAEKAAPRKATARRKAAAADDAD